MRFDFVNFLKCVAIIMITNSHLKWLYPENLSSLACGGAWGCALFFFCSGYTMAHTKVDNFINYALKRILRLYPAIWIWYLITLGYQDDFQWMYIILPRYWFIRAILLFYVLFYFVLKYFNNYLPIIALISFSLSFAIYCNIEQNQWFIDLTNQPQLITWYYYFSIMLLGAWLRDRNIYQIKTSFFLLTLSVAVSFLSVYLVKFICISKELYYLQILFPILLILSCVGFSFFRPFFFQNKLKYIIDFIARHTLEIYVTQGVIIALFEKLTVPYHLGGGILCSCDCRFSNHYSFPRW